MVSSVNIYSLDDFVVRFGDEALAWNLKQFSCPLNRESDRPKLLDFYKGNNFRSWNTRHSKKDGVDYDQMICVLKSA